jgi:D-glycero-alpha-D-manno-heptose-7-phosphate kinase
MCVMQRTPEAGAGETRLCQPCRVQLRAKAPLRVSFAGGGTDVSPFPEQEGGAVLSATINRFVYGCLDSRDDGQIAVDSPDMGVQASYSVDQELHFDGELDLIKAAIKRLSGGEADGYDLFINSSAPPGSGLGSSSAVMVVLVGLLNTRYRLGLDDYEVAQTAWSIEREDLGIKGGLQDQYASTFGGFNFIEFHGDHTIVNPLRVPERVVNELEHNLLLCFTGRTRASDHIIDDQTSRYIAGEDDTTKALMAQKELALEMKKALLRSRPNEFGELLHTSWETKKRMSPRISNEAIDTAYDIARTNGAIGGKVTGAGGGGFMLMYCDFRRRHHVADALTAYGMTVDEISFESRGLTTWQHR